MTTLFAGLLAFGFLVLGEFVFIEAPNSASAAPLPVTIFGVVLVLIGGALGWLAVRE